MKFNFQRSVVFTAARVSEIHRFGFRILGVARDLGGDSSVPGQHQFGFSRSNCSAQFFDSTGFKTKALAYASLGEWELARLSILEAIRVGRDLVQRFPQVEQIHEDLVSFHYNSGFIHAKGLKYEQALEAYFNAERTEIRSIQMFGASAKRHHTFARIHSAVSKLYVDYSPRVYHAKNTANAARRSLD